MQVCISYLFIFVPVINEEYYEKIKILSLLFVCLSIFLSACGDDDTPVPVTVKQS